MLSAHKGNGEVFKLLTDNADININTQNHFGYTALMLAVSEKKYEIVNSLAKNPDIKANIQDKNGYTALMLASYFECDDAIKGLKNMPDTDPNIVNNEKDTALMLAVRKGNVNTAKELLLNFKDIDLTIKDANNKTVLDYKAAKPLKEMLKSYTDNPLQWLIENGAEQDVINAFGNVKLNDGQKQKAIITAANFNKTEIIERIIDQVPDKIGFLNNKKLVTAVINNFKATEPYNGKNEQEEKFKNAALINQLKILSKLKKAYDSSFFNCFSSLKGKLNIAFNCAKMRSESCGLGIDIQNDKICDVKFALSNNHDKINSDKFTHTVLNEKNAAPSLAQK